MYTKFYYPIWNWMLCYRNNRGISGEVFVGAKDVDETSWLWPNNNFLCFNKWKDGQPNGGTDQNCLVIDHKSVFQDKRCTDNFVALCSTTGN